MKKTALYSRSPRSAPAGTRELLDRAARHPAPAAGESGDAQKAAPASGPATPPGAALAAPRPGRWRRTTAWLGRHERWLWASAFLALLALTLAGGRFSPLPPSYTPKQIDAMVRQSLEEKPLPAHAAKAYEAVRGSVVRVVGLMTEGDEGDDAPSAPGATPAPGEKPADKAHGERSVERGVGTGVVIVNNGTILTNLHVVQGARRIKVTFADGMVTDARVVNVQPENDLAVLRARSIPDDLEAATMRSTADLQPGDEVIAVGFPFGIGPSASAGVVSGLKREFNSPDGQQKLTNLIQFDAAANPGNSGGPLVTNDGAVVGIVTAILNPSRQRTFIGIGFAVPIENAASGAGMPPF
jgi:S1-C subfamily serine protease